MRKHTAQLLIPACRVSRPLFFAIYTITKSFISLIVLVLSLSSDLGDHGNENLLEVERPWKYLLNQLGRVCWSSLHASEVDQQALWHIDYWHGLLIFRVIKEIWPTNPFGTEPIPDYCLVNAVLSPLHKSVDKWTGSTHILSRYALY